MIDTFESLVLSQRPASEPWHPVTDYSFDARKAIEGPHPQLIKDVFHPAKVLDAGCGPDAVLVRLLREIGVDARGIDCQIQTDTDQALYGDIAQPWMEWVSEHDLVICREVLEHLTLRQIRHAIANLCKVSSRFVYITTRYSSEHDVLRVETQDNLDPTHITLASKDLIRLLFVLEGFERRADLEERMDHMNKNRVLVYERASK